MIPLVAPHHAVLRLNTRLFLNCMEGVDDAVAARRPGPETNGMGFLALHLLDARYYAFAHSNDNITPGSPRSLRVALTTRF